MSKSLICQSHFKLYVPLKLYARLTDYSSLINNSGCNHPRPGAFQNRIGIEYLHFKFNTHAWMLLKKHASLVHLFTLKRCIKAIIRSLTMSSSSRSYLWCFRVWHLPTRDISTPSIQHNFDKRSHKCRYIYIYLTTLYVSTFSQVPARIYSFIDTLLLFFLITGHIYTEDKCRRISTVETMRNDTRNHYSNHGNSTFTSRSLKW